MALEVKRLQACVSCLMEEVAWLNRRLLGAADVLAGESLLPLAAKVHAGAFAPAELAAAALNDATADGESLRQLIDSLKDDDGQFRGLGKLLMRIHGVSLGGHRLVPAGQSRMGWRYRVQVLDG